MAEHQDKLVILDEVHRLPNLFQNLRGLIDRGRRSGRKAGRFLLLGSASIDLLKQSGETLAGRIAYLEMHPIDGLEVGAADLGPLWVRGGLPDSFLAASDRASQRWRLDFIRTYLERDIPLLGPRVPAETLRRFWTMLAHHQAGLLNAAEFARALGVDGKTVASYLDLLVDLLIGSPAGTLACQCRQALWLNPRASMSATAASPMRCLVSPRRKTCLGIQWPAPLGKGL